MRKFSRSTVWLGASALAICGTLQAQAQDRPPVSHATQSAEPSQAQPPSKPWAHLASDVPVDSTLRFGTLPNGLRYVIKHNATPPGKASVWLRIDAGSLNEKDNQLGLAHFMEHMAFNGTEKIPKNDLIHDLERLGLQFGADLNAATGFDQTFYRLDMPKSSPEDLDTALFVLRQQVSAATMDQDDIDSERGVIRGEERLRNSPAVEAGLKQLAILTNGTIIPKRNPIGDMSIIDSAPRDRFVDYYQAYYRPSRATVIAVGDFDVDTMEKRIKQHFADWQPAAPDGNPPPLGKVILPEKQAHVYFEKSLPPSLSISWLSEPDLSHDSLSKREKHWVNRLALSVLKRRFAEMRKEDNAPFANANADESDSLNAVHIAGVSATYLPGRWQDSLDKIEQAARQFSQYGVRQDELDREIASWRERMTDAVKSAGTRDTVRLAAEFENDVNEDEVITDPKTNLQIFEKVVSTLKLSDVNEAARTVLAGSGPVVSLMTSEPVEGGDAALMAAYDKSHDVPVKSLAAPIAKPWPYTDFGTPGKVTSVSKPDLLGAVTYTFANGVQLKVKHTDFSKNSVSVSLLTGIGDRNFSPDHFDPRSSAVGTLTSGGLNKLTPNEISRALAGHQITAGMATLGQRFMVSGGTQPSDLKLELEYLTAVMSDAAFGDTAYKQVLAGVPTGWALAHSSPAGVFGIEGKPYLASGDKRVAIASPDVVKNWKLDPIRDDVRKMLGAGPIQLVVTGDIDPAQVVKYVSQTFGALPPRPPYNQPAANADIRRFPAGNKEPIVFTHNGLKEQALGTVNWPTTDVIGRRLLPRQLTVFQAVLRLRVLDVIREEEALAYSPGVGADFSPDYKGYGRLEVQAAVSPDKLPAFYAAVTRIVTDLQTKPITQDELDRARIPMIAHHEQAMSTNSWWHQQIVGSFYEPSTINDALKYKDDIMTVTPAMIQQFAREYLVPDKAVRISIVPSNEAS